MHYEDSPQSGIELKLRELIARCDELLHEEASKAFTLPSHLTDNPKMMDRPLYAQMPSVRGRWLRPALRTASRPVLTEHLD